MIQMGSTLLLCQIHYKKDRDPGHRNLIVPRADLDVHTGSRRVPLTVLICMGGAVWG